MNKGQLNIDDFDIEGIVRSILADLTVEPEPLRCTPIQAIDEVFIDSRVVSLSDIKGRLGDARKLLIAPKSILTPSAKDEIRKRKIEVAVKLPNSTVDRRSTIWLAAQRPAVFPASVSSRFDAKTEHFETVAEIIENALKQSSGHRGVALSRQSATLLREANRHEKIRAMIGFEPKQTSEDAAEIDANLLVLHPDRITVVKMFEIVQGFVAPETPPPARRSFAR